MTNLTCVISYTELFSEWFYSSLFQSVHQTAVHYFTSWSFIFFFRKTSCLLKILLTQTALSFSCNTGVSYILIQGDDGFKLSVIDDFFYDVSQLSI